MSIFATPRRNTAENETWGDCVDELPICDEEGRVGYPQDGWYLCTGGRHVAPGKFIRCTSTYHDQEGPMSPGFGLLRATPEEAP